MLIALFALLPETAVHIFLWKFLLYSLGCVSLEKDYTIIIIGKDCTIITKRIEYILEWNLVNPLVCILSVPFSLKGSSKCTNHVNVHKLYAVEYINTVCSLDYPNRL